MKIKILDQVKEYDAPVTVYDAAKDMELITRAVIGAEIAYELLDKVIHGDDTEGSAVFVKYNRNGGAVYLHIFEQYVGLYALRSEISRLYRICHNRITALVVENEIISYVEYTHHVVHRLGANGVTGVNTRFDGVVPLLDAVFKP